MRQAGGGCIEIMTIKETKAIKESFAAGINTMLHERDEYGDVKPRNVGYLYGILACVGNELYQELYNKLEQARTEDKKHRTFNTGCPRRMY
jgi:hypothetical protein